MTELTLFDVVTTWATPLILAYSIKRFRASSSLSLTKPDDAKAQSSQDIQDQNPDFQPAHPPHLQSPNADEAKTVSDEGRPGQ